MNMYELFCYVHSNIGNNVRTMMRHARSSSSSTIAVSGVFFLQDFHPAWLLAMSASMSAIFWRENFLDTVSRLHLENFSSVISAQLIPFARIEATSKQSAAGG
jgi:hypothetical protein